MTFQPMVPAHISRSLLTSNTIKTPIRTLEYMATEKNPSRVAAGLKAAVHNPRVSEEAKESAAERLQQMGEEIEVEQETGPQTRSKGRSPSPITSHRRRSTSGSPTTEGKSESRVMGGYKAALKNPRVSEEAKERAEEVLEQHHVAH